MPKSLLGGLEIETDEDGFIQEPVKWTEAVAEDMARTVEVESMGADHWKVVSFIRDYYLQFGVAPPVRMLCKRTGFDLKYIYELFPGGPAKGACKVAGLPKPTGCV